MKLTVTGMERLDKDTAKIKLQGVNATVYTNLMIIYVPWAERTKYQLENEFTVELWEVVPPAELGEDPAISTRPGGQMNNGLGVQRG